MLPGQEAVGQSPNNWFRGGHTQEDKPGMQDPKVPGGTGQSEVFGCGQRWSMGCLVPRASPAAHPCSLWACPAFLLPQGRSHPCPGCGHPQGFIR